MCLHILQTLPPFPLRYGSTTLELATQPLRAMQWLENENIEEIGVLVKQVEFSGPTNPPNCI